MKYFNKLILLLSLTLVFFSCEKDNELISETTTNDNPELSVKDGIIYFASDSIFSATVDKISKMNDEEYKAWETKIGFKSLRTELDLVYDEMDKCKDSLSFENLILKNSDIIQEEKDAIEPIVKSTTYASLINREGIYYIGALLHKVNGDKLAVSLDGNLDAVENALSDDEAVLKSTSLNNTDNVLIFNYCQSEKDDSSIKLRSTDTKTDAISNTLTHDKRRCKLEMKSVSFAGVYVIGKPSISSRATFVWNTKIEVKIKNYKKSWGKYRSYKTTCEMRNISVSTNFGKGTCLSYNSNSEVTSLTKSFDTWSYSYEQFWMNRKAVAYETQIDNAYGQATNRGIGARWVTIAE